MDILTTYTTIFWEVAEQGVKLVVPVVSIWLIMKLIRSLVLGRR